MAVVGGLRSFRLRARHLDNRHTGNSKRVLDLGCPAYNDQALLYHLVIECMAVAYASAFQTE